MTLLPDSARALVESGRLAHCVTIDPDGGPQVSAVWIGVEGEGADTEIVMAHLGEHRKVRNLRRADAPCYACLYPEDGEVEEVQCSTMGVFAPLTGVVGALQAMEAAKLLIGAGETLSGRLLLMDARQADWRTVKLKKDPACGVCGR